ncbi:MAG: hypothetical protein IPG76_22615 [Acidobacteria bacterium]|nr:hypothetical protein [Acidobacteriota bacterium]
MWIDGQVGFVSHHHFTTLEAEREEKQPYSLDGKVRITADARIDGRDELILKLESRESIKLSDPTDPELILRAYLAWGESCLDHLIGDFSFAIWDGHNHKLFCARDHFGVKPFSGPKLVIASFLETPFIL